MILLPIVVSLNGIWAIYYDFLFGEFKTLTVVFLFILGDSFFEVCVITESLSPHLYLVFFT